MNKIESLQKSFTKLNVKSLSLEDPSKNNKYLEWMCRELNSGAEKEDVLGTIQGYHTYINALKCDINNLSCKELEDKLKNHLNKLKIKEKENGLYNKLYEDDKILLIHILDTNAAIHYGKNT